MYGRAVAKREPGRERRPRPGARGERGRQALLEPEHLRAGAERPAERRDHRRAVQPPAARGGRDHVAPAVDRVQVHGVAARRLAATGRHEGADDGRQPAETGHVVVRGVLGHERPPLVVVLAREQALERRLRARRVAVEGVAIGERELGALGDHVHELLIGELGEVIAGEQRELLQADRTRSPRQRLADGQPAVLERGDGLDGGAPGREVVRGQQAILLGDETVDLCRDEPLVEGSARPLDPVLARAAARLVGDAAIRGGENRVAKERADLGRRQVELARGRARSRAAPRCARSWHGCRRRAGNPARRSRSRTRGRPRRARCRTARGAGASRRTLPARRRRARPSRARARDRGPGSARSWRRRARHPGRRGRAPHRVPPTRRPPGPRRRGRSGAARRPAA